MYIPTLSFILFTLSTAWCQQNPIITSITQDKIVDMGQNTVLSCSVQYKRNYPVMWIKKNKGSDLFISTNKAIVFPDQRYSLTSDEGSNTYKLQIQGVTQTDNGVYECKIQIGPTTEIAAEVNLFVRLKPIISDNSTRSVLEKEGAVVELFCHASGFPTPKITWHREDNKVLPSGGAIHKGTSLKIHSIRKEDRGIYFCVADNGVGNGARRNIPVDVEFAPVITVQRLKYSQALTYDMDLQCTVEAYPSPYIEWIKENTILINDQHFGISNFATSDQTTDTNLRVITIQKNQFGEYTCKAVNKLGSSSATMDLYEQFVPACPPACDVDVNRISSGNMITVNAKFIFLLTSIWSIFTFSY